MCLGVNCWIPLFKTKFWTAPNGVLQYEQTSASCIDICCYRIKKSVWTQQPQKIKRDRLINFFFKGRTEAKSLPVQTAVKVILDWSWTRCNVFTNDSLHIHTCHPIYICPTLTFLYMSALNTDWLEGVLFFNKTCKAVRCSLPFLFWYRCL